MKPSLSSSRLRRRLSLVGWTALASWPALLAAQETTPAPVVPPPPPSDIIELEEYTVTGSNIRRVDAESTLPVTVLDFQDLEVRGGSTPVELFEFLPQAGELPISEEGTLGASARGDVASIALRSIGSGSTLVLVDGRRMAPHPISQSEGGIPSLAVNVNTLPGAMIDRIEILREGASAIYGADAAAGVVNAILERGAADPTVRLRWSDTEDGGGSEWRVSYSQGWRFNEGRTTLRFAADHFHREMLRASDRSFSADSDQRPNAPAPWDGQSYPRVTSATGTLTDNDFDNSSTASIYGSWVRGYFSTDPVTGETSFVGNRRRDPAGSSTATMAGILTSGTSRVLTFGTDGRMFIQPTALDADGNVTDVGMGRVTPSRTRYASDGSINPSTEWYYNLNQNRFLLPETDRTNFVFALDHKFGNGLELFGDFMAYRAKSNLYRDPAGADSTDDPNLHVPAANYWNPTGERFYHPTGEPNADGTPRLVGTPADLLIAPSTGVRVKDFKAKDADVLSNAYRAVTGVRGLAFDRFNWEAAALHSWAKTEDNERFNIRESRMREALARSDMSALNPFGYEFFIDPNNSNRVTLGDAYTNPDSVIDPLYDDFLRVGRTSVSILDIKATGPVKSFPGGDIQMAAGLEYRHETYEDYRPPFAGLNPADAVADRPDLFRPNDNDFIGLSPNVDFDTARDVYSVFAEYLIPFIGAPNRNAFARSLELSLAARYETFSDFGDTLKPKATLSWRPREWLMFRTSYNESFRAPNLVSTNTTPLQRSVSSISDPYRFDVTSLLLDGSVSRTVVRQGNEELQPEEAAIYTVGVVFEIPAVRGLSFTFDYWNINQTEVINNLSASEQLRRDEAALDAYTQAQLAAGIPIDQVVAQSSGFYAGNPKVVRLPLTPDDQTRFDAYNQTAAPGTERAAVGAVQLVIDDYINLAGRDLEGVDMAFEYRVPKTAIGTFTVRGEATWTRKYQELLTEGGIVENNLGENGVAKWKGNLSLLWRNENWSAGYFVNYVASTIDSSAAIFAESTAQEDIDAFLASLGGMPGYMGWFSNSQGVIRLGYRVEDWIQQNAYVQYRTPRSMRYLGRITARIGVNNLWDREPSLADESRGYRTGSSNPRGRQFYVQLTKTF